MFIVGKVLGRSMLKLSLTHCHAEVGFYPCIFYPCRLKEMKFNTGEASSICKAAGVCYKRHKTELGQPNW